jgi:hypothetical protein
MEDPTELERQEQSAARRSANPIVFITSSLTMPRQSSSCRAMVERAAGFLSGTRPLGCGGFSSQGEGEQTYY